MTMMATIGESEGSGTDGGPGGEAAGGGETLEATSRYADAAGSGGRHGAKKRERERFDGQQVLWSGNQRGGP